MPAPCCSTAAAPDHVIDVTNALRDDISGTDGGGLRIGAAVRNSDLAAHPAIRRDYPLLARAVLTGASGQIRNAATVGGNLLQRTRCPYFQDVTMPCNKRSPGSGCQATRPGADTEHLAILGHSPFCVATHPSDMAVTLTALGAGVRVAGPDGDRWLEMPGLHRLPDGLPERDTALRPGGRLPGRARRGRARAVARARRGTGRPRPAAGPGTDAEAGHRVEGTDKVTGRARYAHEYPVPDAVHAFPVLAPVARGRIGEIDPGRALAMPGVLAVVGGVTTLTFGADDFELALFTSPEVTYRGQLVAVAIADTAENARAAGRRHLHDARRAQQPDGTARRRRRPRRRAAGQGGADQAAGAAHHAPSCPAERARAVVDARAGGRPRGCTRLSRRWTSPP